ncbi:MAG: hypothetical protein U0703_23745 [Anaerolineae bacterium]
MGEGIRRGLPQLRQLLKSRSNMDMWELEQQTIDLLHQNNNGFGSDS